MSSRILAVILLSFALVTSVASQTKPSAPDPSPANTEKTKIDPTKEADIRHLMEILKMDSLITQMMQSMGDSIKPVMNQSLPPGEYREKLIDLFIAKFRSKADAKQLIDMALPLYDKYFTDEEIKALTKFYETPVGRKSVSTLPQLTMEMQQEGKAWGENLGRESMQEVLAEHPDLADAMQAAAMKGRIN